MNEFNRVDPEKNYTITLTGEQWMTVMAAVMGTGARLMQPARKIEEFVAGEQLLDVGVELVKQIDPEGWEATTPTPDAMACFEAGTHQLSSRHTRDQCPVGH